MLVSKMFLCFVQKQVIIIFILVQRLRVIFQVGNLLRSGLIFIRLRGLEVCIIIVMVENIFFLSLFGMVCCILVFSGMLKKVFIVFQRMFIVVRKRNVFVLFREDSGFIVYVKRSIMILFRRRVWKRYFLVFLLNFILISMFLVRVLSMKVFFRRLNWQFENFRIFLKEQGMRMVLKGCLKVIMNRVKNMRVFRYLFESRQEIFFFWIFNYLGEIFKFFCFLFVFYEDFKQI